MELPGSAYLYTLATPTMTFAGFCAIVNVLRQMSALLRIADSRRTSLEVRNVPIASNALQQRALRGRDASYLAPPAQIRTCGFPAYGSHLGYRRQFVAVCEPTPCVTLIRL
jgi:hypothetical protein